MAALHADRRAKNGGELDRDLASWSVLGIRACAWLSARVRKSSWVELQVPRHADFGEGSARSGKESVRSVLAVS